MKYFIKALIVYLIAMVILMVVNETVSIELDTLHLSLCGLFMCGTSVAVHYFTMRSSKKNPNRFPSYFMTITGLKMLLYLAAISIYVLLFREQAVYMLIAFLAFYLIYTFLEVTSIVSDFKKTD